MMSKRPLLVIILALWVVACSGDAGPGSDDVIPQGADTPVDAVEELVDHLGQGEFNDAAPLAIPGQAALASLAEGATIDEVAGAVRNGDGLIAANFWSGFAQSVEPWLTEGVEASSGGEVVTEETEFNLVEVRVLSEPPRIIATRDVDGYRIDLFATFGPSLASRLYPRVERLFDSDDPDASFILESLREQIASFHQAALTPGLAPNVVQDILQLIELISRVA